MPKPPDTNIAFYCWKQISLKLSALISACCLVLQVLCTFTKYSRNRQFSPPERPQSQIILSTFFRDRLAKLLIFMSFLKSYSVLTHLVPWQRAGPFCLWLFFGPFQALCLRTSSLTGQRRRGGDPTTPLCLARPVDSTGLQRSIHKGRSGHLKLDKTPKYPACKKGHQARTSRVAGAL